MTTPDAYDIWNDTIERVARWTAADFPDIELNDVIQELYAFVLSKKTLKGPEQEGAVPVLRKAAKDYAWRLRKEQLHISVQYGYRTSDVRKMLETAFNYREWEEAFVPVDARSQDHDDTLVTQSDIKWAYDRVPRHYQRELVSRYRDRIEPPGGSAARKRLDRAVQRLAEVLNTYQKNDIPKVGDRQVISNSEAGWMVDNQD